VVAEILNPRPASRGTDIGCALDLLGHVTRRRAVAFLLSDFVASGYQHALRIAARRHDLIPVQIVDPREEELPDLGLVLVEDLESGELGEVDTGNKSARDSYAALAAKQKAAREQLFRRLSLDYLTIYTHRPYVRPIVDLFRLRQKRRQRQG
jgi:uncharacterized protein (DUF58 family)